MCLHPKYRSLIQAVVRRIDVFAQMVLPAVTSIRRTTAGQIEKVYEMIMWEGEDVPIGVLRSEESFYVLTW
jgi:hypothetical protein